MNIAYWEYIIKIWNDVDSEEEERAGVVSATTMTEAVQEIENAYYDNEILNIITLKYITDSVLDIKEANDNNNFDFIIIPKSAT